MGHRKILVADDEVNILKSLALVLTEEGYEVLTATNGEDALKLALSEAPDLLILDIKMPGKSGKEVSIRLREEERGKNIPVILLTALGKEFHRNKDYKIDGVDYITKPFSPYAVVERVNKILKG